MKKNEITHRGKIIDITPDFTTITDYTYDPVTLLPITQRVQLSDGTYWDKSFRYPKDYNVFPYDYLYEKHILTPVVEERNKHNGIIFHSILSEMDEDGNIIYNR